MRRLVRQRHEPAIGKRARIVEEDAGAATQYRLRLFRAAAGAVAGDTALESDADVGLDQIGGGARAPQTHLLLRGGLYEHHDQAIQSHVLRGRAGLDCLASLAMTNLPARAPNPLPPFRFLPVRASA